MTTARKKLNKLKRDFDKIYSDFYNSERDDGDEVCVFKNETFYMRRSCELHDDDAKENLQYLAMLNLFASFRGDLIVSDRECASFWVAYQYLK